MQRIKITPNLTSTSVTYLDDNGVTGISYVKNPYTSAGCSGASHCNDYTAVTKCLIDIYQGIRACQTIYLLDKNGELLDLDRLEWIDLTIMNEFGCSVYWFSTLEKEYYNNIEILQKDIKGTILSVNFENWNDFLQNNVFDYTENLVGIINNCIFVGNNKEVGEIIFNPVKYNDRLYITLTPCSGYEDITTVVKMNGSPNPVKLGETTELISVTGDDGNAMLDIVSQDPNRNVVEIYLSNIELSTNARIQNKGAIKVCFESYETMHMMPANLTGVLTFKFKNDDPEEEGSVHVVDCIGIGRVYKNVNLDDDLETPIISHEVRPEHIVYDNTNSGLQSTVLTDAFSEFCHDMNDHKNDKYYWEYFGEECMYDDVKKLYYWDVWHNLKVEGVDVTLEDDNGNDIEGDVEYISNEHLMVWFTECVFGYVYIN